MAKSGEQHRIRVGIVAYGLDRPGSGISRYTVELISALRDHRPDIAVTVLKPFAGTVPGLDDIGAVAPLPGARRLPAMMTLGPIETAVAAIAHRLDVVHDPTGISPFLLPRVVGRYGRIVTIHDTVPFVHPNTHARLTNFLFRGYIPRTLRFVDRIVTVSDASKRDIERFLLVGPHRVHRIHCGCGPLFRPPEPSVVNDVIARYGIERPYLLAVGALEARKNLNAVLDAFARLRSMGVNLRLVIVGRRAWKADGIFRRLEELNLGNEVLLTGYVDDVDLPALYAGAACFVFPSLYEGFGLPPLEAMACGTPVVTSNTSSLPEVVGDAGIMVDPHDVDAIVGAVRRIVEHPQVASELRERGYARAAQFTWEQAADEHAALYRTVVNDRRASRPTTSSGVSA